MKKFSVLAVVLMALFVLAACGGGVLADEEHSYFATGQFAGWDQAFGKDEYRMEAVALNDDRISDLRSDLRGADYIYVIEVTFPAGEAGWDVTYKIDGQTNTYDGNLTLKVVRTTEAEEDIPLWWGQSPESGKFNNLTPGTLYIPPFQEENIDEAGAWNDNPVVLEAGTYYIVYAQVGTDRYVGAIKK